MGGILSWLFDAWYAYRQLFQTRCPECNRSMFECVGNYCRNSDSHKLSAEQQDVIREVTRKSADNPRVTNIIQPAPSDTEKRQHATILDSLTGEQKIAVDYFEAMAKQKGGEFLLTNQSQRVTNLDDFFAGLAAKEYPETQRLSSYGMKYVLSLKASDFDDAGNFRFPNPKGELQKRGGMDYFQPSSDWVRIGLRVRGRYGNDDWLRMDGHPDEWAVGFHGSTIGGTIAITESREFKVFPNGRQACATSDDVNDRSDRIGQPCGHGIYFGSQIDICVDQGYSRAFLLNNQVVMQVRLNPRKTRIPSICRDYRIVNKPEDARVYGICVKVSKNNTATYD